MLVDGFLSFLYQVLGKEEHEQGVEAAMMDLHAFQFFVNMEYNDCDQPPMVTHDIQPYVYDPARITNMMLRPQTHDAEPISFPLLPDQGITRKELYIIKLTAQFVSVFGMCFGQDLMKSVFMKPELEPLFRFMLSTDTRHGFYSQLTIGYTRVLLCIEKLMEKGDSTETVLEGFFDLLDKVLEREEEGLEMAILDLQAFEFFVKVEYTDWRQRIPGYLSILKYPPPQMHSPLGSQLSHTQVHRPHSMRMIRLAPLRRRISRFPSLPLSEESEPMKPNLDVSTLVPEDQFLAQHPGPSTIKVSVPTVDDGQVIEITVQSLSENVASLKEKIANKLELIGQQVTCTLQCRSRRHPNTVFVMINVAW